MRIILIAKEKGEKPELNEWEVDQLPRIGDHIEYSNKMIDSYINKSEYYSCEILTVEKVIHAKDKNGWYYIVIGNLSFHMTRSLLYE